MKIKPNKKIRIAFAAIASYGIFNLFYPNKIINKKRL